MALDHDAIRKAYPDAVVVSDAVGHEGAWKEDGTQITLVQSAIDSARATIDAEAAATEYQRKRTGTDETVEKVGTTDTIYLPIGEQLDLLYKDIVAGTVTTSGGFATAIKATKDKYPKP
tara:strand:+ start:157 stop:513 length:357 start_codon:yes stop_codon:yes gene_type:complete